MAATSPKGNQCSLLVPLFDRCEHFTPSDVLLVPAGGTIRIASYRSVLREDRGHAAAAIASTSDEHLLATIVSFDTVL
jgi:hypothetical protein